jgi:RNA polymerase sigma-70 factor (sigma-E family)
MVAVAERDGRRTSGASAEWVADNAVAELYAAHWASLVRLAWLLLRDQSHAEEVVQDAFIAVHRAWGSLRRVDRAEAYLRRAVVNGARSSLRHQGVERRHLARERSDPLGPYGATAQSSAEQTALDHEASSTMMQALSRLPRRQREVLTLRYYLDLSESQIADALGISTGSVKAHAHRGLAALREAWGDTR